MFVYYKSGSGKKQLKSLMEGSMETTATVDVDKLILDFSTWEEVHLRNTDINSYSLSLSPPLSQCSVLLTC